MNEKQHGWREQAHRLVDQLEGDEPRLAVGLLSRLHEARDRYGAWSLADHRNLPRETLAELQDAPWYLEMILAQLAALGVVKGPEVASKEPEPGPSTPAEHDLECPDVRLWLLRTEGDESPGEQAAAATTDPESRCDCCGRPAVCRVRLGDEQAPWDLCCEGAARYLKCCAIEFGRAYVRQELDEVRE